MPLCCFFVLGFFFFVVVPCVTFGSLWLPSHNKTHHLPSAGFCCDFFFAWVKSEVMIKFKQFIADWIFFSRPSDFTKNAASHPQRKNWQAAFLQRHKDPLQKPIIVKLKGLCFLWEHQVGEKKPKCTISQRLSAPFVFKAALPLWRFHCQGA